MGRGPGKLTRGGLRIEAINAQLTRLTTSVSNRNKWKGSVLDAPDDGRRLDHLSPSSVVLQSEELQTT